MARTLATNFTSTLQFPKATTSTDLFKKEDVQTLAEAVDQHDHSSGKGVVVNVAGIAAGALNGSAITDNTITSAKITDGTIATADLANAAVTNAKLAADTARANLLTNGGFEVWQRGNGPFTGPVGTARTADTWYFAGTAGDTYSLSRDAANMDSGSTACGAVSFTKGTGTTGLTQQLVFADHPSLKGRAVSFSVRVRTSTANAVRAGIYDGSAWQYGAYHPGNGTYQTLTVANITLGGTYAMVAVWFDVSCTAYIDNAMLVVGSQPADYAPLHPADDLARCLRYYQRHSAGGGFTYIAPGQAYSTTAAMVQFPLLAQLAVTPSLTTSGGATLTLQSAAASGTGGASVVVATSSTAITLNVTGVTGLVAGNATWLMSNNTAAWLAVEGNP